MDDVHVGRQRLTTASVQATIVYFNDGVETIVVVLLVRHFRRIQTTGRLDPCVEQLDVFAGTGNTRRSDLTLWSVDVC